MAGKVHLADSVGGPGAGEPTVLTACGLQGVLDRTVGTRTQHVAMPSKGKPFRAVDPEDFPFANEDEQCSRCARVLSSRMGAYN